MVLWRGVLSGFLRPDLIDAMVNTGYGRLICLADEAIPNKFSPFTDECRASSEFWSDIEAFDAIKQKPLLVALYSCISWHSLEESVRFPINPIFWPDVQVQG